MMSGKTNSGPENLFSMKTETDKTNLEPLVEEHRRLLELCEHIRKGLALGVETGRIRKYADWFKNQVLQPHFETEEQLLFSALGRNARVKKAQANHRRILRLLSCSCEDVKVLNLLEEELQTYIRFEEKTLFTEYESASVKLPKEEIVHHHRQSSLHQQEWDDPFWTGI